MKVITLLSIFVLFFIINGLIASASKENNMEESEAAAARLVNLCKGILGAGRTTQAAGGEDNQDEKEGAEVITLSDAD